MFGGSARLGRFGAYYRAVLGRKNHDAVSATGSLHHVLDVGGTGVGLSDNERKNVAVLDDNSIQVCGVYCAPAETGVLKRLRKEGRRSCPPGGGTSAGGEGEKRTLITPVARSVCVSMTPFEGVNTGYGAGPRTRWRQLAGDSSTT